MERKKLEELITFYNIRYREGDPVVSDYEYDNLLEELSSKYPDSEILTKIGESPKSRKVDLPLPMFSMNKIKDLEEFSDWIRLKSIQNGEFIIMPKFDGLSLIDNLSGNFVATRGDGITGQSCLEHFKFINKDFLIKDDIFTWGEVIMSKSNFNKKWSESFSNPRNLVGGLINSKELNKEALSDVDYIRYGLNGRDFKRKSDLLDFLNDNQKVKVDYKVIDNRDISESLLDELFKKWSYEYEIDGLIIEVNDLDSCNRLGREMNGNPVFARAYKSTNFEKSIITKVINIEWNISKRGFLKPILNIEPVELDGVIISNVTGYNARFVMESGIGVGSIIRIVRSGMVIPKVIEVLQKVEFVLPNIDNIEWDSNGVELITKDKTDEQSIKQIISFFEVLEVDGVSSGIIRQLWDSGFKSIKDILSLKPSDMEKLDGFGKRKAKNVYDSIQSKTKSVKLHILRHASGLFKNLGSKKLLLLNGFKEKPTIADILEIDGFAEISARSFIDSWDDFQRFSSDLGIEIDNEEVESKSDALKDKVFVFTGVRLKDKEIILESLGAKIGSSISKSTTYLVCKDVSSSSSKLLKAKDLGVNIINVEELENLINKYK
jgi:NAD-dependent DNA ligase